MAADGRHPAGLLRRHDPQRAARGLHRARPQGGRTLRGDARSWRPCRGQLRAHRRRSRARPARPSSRRATTRSSTRSSRTATVDHRARLLHAGLEDGAGPGGRRERADRQRERRRRVPGHLRRHVGGRHERRRAGGPRAGLHPDHRVRTWSSPAAQAIVEGRMFGSVWPAPDEMAKAGAAVAVALAKCEPFDVRATDRQRRRRDPVRRDPHLSRGEGGDGRLRLPDQLLVALASTTSTRTCRTQKPACG